MRPSLALISFCMMLCADASADPPPCPTDDNEPNDMRQQARFPHTGDPIDASACGPDVDWYAVHGYAGCHLRAEVVNLGGATLRLELHDIDATIAIESAQGTGTLLIDRTFETSKLHFLRVSLDSGPPSSYTLLFEYTCASPPLVCPPDAGPIDEYEPNDTMTAATGIAAGVEAQAIACPNDVDDFSVMGHSPCSLSADLYFDGTTGSLALTLMGPPDPSGADGPLLAGGHPNEANLFTGPVTIGSNGPYYVKVAPSAPGLRDAYSLQVRETCPACVDDEYEENDSNGVPTWLTAPATLNATACGADLDHYAIDVDAGCTIHASLAFTLTTGDVQLSMFDSSGAAYGPPGAPTVNGRTLDLMACTAGRYVIRAALADAIGSNAYSLTVSTTCPPGPPPPAACDDDRPCTFDACDPVAGCSHTPFVTTCTDGNACTLNDHCEQESCVSDGTMLVCDDGDLCTDDGCDPSTGCVSFPNVNPCNDGNVCTTDDCEPIAGCTFTANVVLCDDGDACTSVDQCASSVCVPGAPTTCDDGEACTDDGCIPASGCQHDPNANPCDDGDICTGPDTCLNGGCSGFDLDCNDGNPCTWDWCGLQGCDHSNPTISCDDGEPCTSGDFCDEGTCYPGPTTTDCDDANVCTGDFCVPGVGCTHDDLSGPCLDSDACWEGDFCAGGACQPGPDPKSCGDGNECTEDQCANGACWHAPLDGAPCDDGDSCTAIDQCIGWQCSYDPAPCDDGNDCTADACDSATGTCLHSASSGPCSDGNACTDGDTCVQGACQPGAPVECPVAWDCQTRSCDPQSGCEVPVFNPGAPCSDQDACTDNDTCAIVDGQQVCLGTPKPDPVCNDGLVCTEDTCDSASGCVNAPHVGPCDDGNPCTKLDGCQGTDCVGITYECPGDACSTGTCDGEGGCTVVPRPGTPPCDDGEPCTSGDFCREGACQAGPTTPACSDNNPCTLDFCQPEVGCTHAPYTAPCSDGNACTSDDRCIQGQCASTAPDPCDDGNACTEDSCTPSVGCSHTPISGPCDDLLSCTSDDTCAGGSCQGSVTSPPCIDGTAPTWTSPSLVATAVGLTRVTLVWSGASDNVAVTSYRLLQDGVAIAALPASTQQLEVTELWSGREYVFQVEAGDAADNWSTNGPSATVTTALPPPPAFVATALDRSVTTTLPGAVNFLHTGPDPIQSGVASGTIEARRGALLRGTVRDHLNSPIPGVRITIHRHPELGSTASRATGEFDLVVNGGGPLVVVFEKPGLLPVHRQVEVPWRDYVHVPAVVMTPVQAQAFVDTLAPTPDGFHHVEGLNVQDASGSRTAVAIITAGTVATFPNADGEPVSLTSFTVQLTEYTVDPNGLDAMPATLPPTSAYTYAIELGLAEAVLDGYKIVPVTFSGAQKVRFYVDNFLDFPSGADVPVGYYDADAALWVPQASGRVVTILPFAGDEALVNVDGERDAAGDLVPSSAAALDALDLTPGERQRLATIYAGRPLPLSLWRVEMDHFSVWDLNWGVAPPPLAKRPEVPRPEDLSRAEDTDRRCHTNGSIIECESQVLGETIDLPGTGLSLVYRSDHVPGWKDAMTLNIPLSNEDPAFTGALRVDVEVRVAGRRFVQSYSPAPKLVHQFTWDGRDAYGRLVQGAQAIDIDVGYAYEPDYALTSKFASTGEFAGGMLVTSNAARTEIILWTRWSDVLAGTWDARAQSLGGWTLSAVHSFDVISGTLHSGDGTRKSVAALGMLARRAAGGGAICTPAGPCGDGGPAPQATLLWPVDVATTADGGYFIAERDLGSPSWIHRIRFVSAEGTISTIAGNGPLCAPGDSCGDGGLAKDAYIEPTSIDVGPDGSLFVADARTHRVRRIWTASPDPSEWSITAHSGADDIDTSSLTVASSGEVYTVENQRVRVIGVDGMIAPFAGTGTSGGGGNGGPAQAALLSNPSAVGVASDGSVYITESTGKAVRRVGPDGFIERVAGNSMASCGISERCGDGGPAVQAVLIKPLDIAVAPDGTFYVADQNTGWEPRIRRVGRDGIIDTVAGCYTDDTQCRPISALGSSATRHASLGAQNQISLKALALQPNGGFLTVDGAASVVYAISPFQDGLASAELTVPTHSGGTAHVFDADGRHLRTESALRPPVAGILGAPPTTSIEVDEGRVTDVFGPSGEQVSFIPSNEGRTVTVVPRFGLPSTILDLDAGGYLGRVTYANGASITLSYNTKGLLTSLADLRGTTHTFEYDAAGRLIEDADGAGGGKTLSRSGSGKDYQVTVTTKLGRSTLYRVEDRSPVYCAPTCEPGQCGDDGCGGSCGGCPPGERCSPISRNCTPATGACNCVERECGDDQCGGTCGICGPNEACSLAGKCLPPGSYVRRASAASGPASEVVFGPDGSRESVSADGTRTSVKVAPDSRWGMASPVMSEYRVTLPSGLSLTKTSERNVTLASPLDPLSVLEQVDTVSFNDELGAFETRYHVDLATNTRTITVTTPEDRQSSVTLDALGRPVRFDPAGDLEPTILEYDPVDGRLVLQSTGSRTTFMSYADYPPRTMTVVDALGQETSLSIDSVADTATMTRPDQQVTTVALDPDGNVRTVTPPGKPDHVFHYDARGAVSEYLPPGAGGQVSYEYDDDGLLAVQVEPDTSIIVPSYDPATGRLTAIAAHPSALSPPSLVVAYGYEPVSGRLQSVIREGTAVSFTRDGPKLIGVTTSFANWCTGGPPPCPSVSHDVTWTLDDHLRRATEQFDGDGSIVFGYDLDGLLVRAGSLYLERSAASGFLEADCIGSATGSGGGPCTGNVRQALTYNAHGEVVSRVVMGPTGPLLDVTYARDAVGRISALTESVLGAPPITRSFQYDLAGRLVEVSQSGEVIGQYAYDANGNRTGSMIGIESAAWTYDARDRLLGSSNGAISYTYQNDRLATRTTPAGTSTFAYDAFGGLTSVTTAGATVSYVLSGQGRRVIRLVNGQRVQGFVYADGLSPIAELDGAGSLVSRFVYGTRTNAPDYMVRGGQTYRIVSDHLGSPRLVVNVASGQVRQTQRFDEFGRVLDHSELDEAGGVLWHIDATGTCVEGSQCGVPAKVPFQPFGFAGGIADLGTGLVRFGARDYDPIVGRWTATDPSLFDGGQSNLSSYCDNDPVNRVDPDGLTPVAACLVLGPAAPECAGVVLAAQALAAGAGLLMAMIVTTPDYSDVDAGGDETCSIGHPDDEDDPYCKIVCAQAKLMYPEKANKYELHHTNPRYLWGKKGNTTVVRMNAAYHQLITNFYRNEFPYGQPPPTDLGKLVDFLEKVERKYPTKCGMCL